MEKDFFKKGFAKIQELIPVDEVEKIRVLYDRLLNDKQSTSKLRSDLGGDGRTKGGVEKITQIMRPSLVEPKLLESIAYDLGLSIARKLLGDDMDLDFDMLINKAPYTNTPTPWHQDAAYWIKMPDKRAVSCWIALDNVNEDNGCMWFIPKEDSTIREHRLFSKGGALYCDVDAKEAQCVPLQSGGCTFHDGYTLHFSKGNITSNQRRVLILNFRPKKMIDFEREHGVDHTGERKIRNSK